MAQQPILIFPEPATAKRSNLGGGRGTPLHHPTPQEQKLRLEQKFQSIAAGIQSVQTSIVGAEPEQVIVFETRGTSINDLVKAARRIWGLEWLAEIDLDEVAPDANFFNEEHPDARLPCRLYAVMTNQGAMTKILSLWNAWIQNPTKRAVKGFGPFKTLFENLSDVRRWGPQDRIEESQIIEDWRSSLVTHGDQPVRFETELWFRNTEGARIDSYTKFQNLVAAQRGTCLAQCAIAGINYHGVLVEMPADAVRQTLGEIDQGQYTDLLRCEGVMFFRPLGQAGFVANPATTSYPSVGDRFITKTTLRSDPVIALLDGLPLENHAALSGRLLIDDPDGYSAKYQSAHQIHGTGMASLISHGDLGAKESELASSLYVRPILTPSQDFIGRVHENIPSDSLIVDLIHRAVHRFADEPSTKRSSIKIVNFSIGDNQKPFIRELSPLARLLDWLAWKYKLLFLVSAGNQMQPVELEVDGLAFQQMPDDTAIEEVLTAIHDDQVSRRHWSPAEAVNVVTVGAVHADYSSRAPGDRRVDLLRNARLPAPFGTVGAGFRRAVKPEILMPGGRLLYRAPFATQSGIGKFEPQSPNQHPPGQLVAAPGVMPMELNRAAFSCGTSNATALASRTAAITLSRVEELLRDYSGLSMAEDQVAAILKTILVHGASWGSAGETIEKVFANQATTWQQKNRLKARFLGFGEVDPERCFYCTDQRAMVLGWGYLEKDKGHEYHLPLPLALNAQRIKRRLTLTLGWLTPINCQHRDYRQAHLWFSFNKSVLGLDNEDLDQDSAERGTVVHQVFRGDKPRAFTEPDFAITVSCREQAGKLTERIPYAFAATLEVAEELDLPIYEQVRERVRPKVPIRPGVGKGDITDFDQAK